MLGDRGRVDHAGVRALVDAGMGIGSHGWSHRDWRRIDDGQATRWAVTSVDSLSTTTTRSASETASRRRSKRVIDLARAVV